jgi:predicted metal-binding protein
MRQMLRIRRSEEAGLTIFGLSGRIEEGHVDELEALLRGAATKQVVLDLDEVRLVDRQVVKFLVACEASGIRVKNCPPYVREWMETRSNKP